MIAIVARAECSSLGDDAFSSPIFRVGERATTRVVHDEELAISGLTRPFAARARIAPPAERDRATSLLESALTTCAERLDEVLPRWRSLRVGAAIGTSSGGMRMFERIVGDGGRESSRLLAATYGGPWIDVERPVAFEPVSLVLGACASSTLAIGLGRAWLLADRCDVVLCGGFDAVSVFVAAGFESLRATCGPRGPRPFRENRDGLALGEAAAVVALVRASSANDERKVQAWLTGFGATCDALHLTAPDAKGIGLARAARAAIDEALGPPIELVSCHGTATRQNDASEAAALGSVLGEASQKVPSFSLKGTTGHTLGAAGALELIATTTALHEGLAPATFGEGPSEAGLRVLDESRSSPARTALKLSAAFGGVNAALVVSTEPPSCAARPPLEHVFVSAAVAPARGEAEPDHLARRSGYAADRIARADDLVRFAMAATASLEDALGGPGTLRGAGIVVGHGLATLETNAKFLSKLRSAGASRAEPRRFPYTTPNAAAGECAVAFHLTGPAFAVGGGPHGGIEALGVAADLVRAGVVDRVVVVAVDEAGAFARELFPRTEGGAVALLVGAERRFGAARLESYTVRLEAKSPPVCEIPSLAAHSALLPLVSGRPPEVIAPIPWGGIAKARFFWL